MNYLIISSNPSNITKHLEYRMGIMKLSYLNSINVGMIPNGFLTLKIAELYISVWRIGLFGSLNRRKKKGKISNQQARISLGDLKIAHLRKPHTYLKRKGKQRKRK